jgi:hypothetical protein
MPEQNRTTGPKVSSLLKLGMGFALIGAALAAAGIAAIRHALHGGATLGVTGIVAGVGGMALGGYLVWGFRLAEETP